jgi:SAM-dependent methyltransferase
MQMDFVSLLRCPLTGSPLTVEDPVHDGGRIRSGVLRTADGRHRYPVRDFIPRFVPESNYADNFGMQWNMFRRTQLDSHSGHPISTDRFRRATAWPPDVLAGTRVLDAGCGAGRFAEVALEAGAHVVALDYSAAVDACWENLKHHPNLNVVQGDIYRLPFAPGTFPLVYSLGVLQHTPDVAAAVAALPPMLAPGGRLCIDFYQRSWRQRLLPYYWLRPVTRRLPKARLFDVLEVAVPRLLSVSRLLGRVPIVGRQLRRIVPVANYEGMLPLDPQQHAEWSLLDTFDWLAPEYDNPQTPATVRGWLESAGLQAIEVEKVDHLVGRGRAPLGPAVAAPRTHEARV